jgi:hypothetical protein
LEEAEVERRMQAGAWSDQGFLASGWSLGHVLDEDLRELRSLDLDEGTVADRLHELIAAGRNSDWARPAQAGQYTIEIIRARGFLTCPWAPGQFEPCPHGSHGRPTANRFRIVHVPSGVSLQGFELGAHMIGAHRFFGGPDTPFRLEPGLLARLLGLR